MKNNRRLVVVDFLRGFSIFTIVLMHLVQSYHLPGFLQKATSLGGAGVHVFILCSGFGLYLSSLYKTLTYGQFLKRRFSKVYIPYLIVVIVSALYFVTKMYLTLCWVLSFYTKCLFLLWNMHLAVRCGSFQQLSNFIYFGL